MLLCQIDDFFGVEVVNMEIVVDHNTRVLVEKKEKCVMHMSFKTKDKEVHVRIQWVWRVPKKVVI